jgi:Skp family chaperone for outer membrane proteins
MALLTGSAVAWALLVTVAAAQNGSARAPAGPQIALVDIQKLFSENQAHKNRMEDFRKWVGEVDAYFKGQNDKLRALAEKRKTYEVGKPEYVEADRQFTEMQIKFQAEYTQKEKEIKALGAKYNLKTYKEIQDIIKDYAEKRGIAVVMKFTSVDPDPNKPNEIMAELNMNPFLYHHTALDITQDILDIMKQQNAAVTERSAAGARR